VATNKTFVETKKKIQELSEVEETARRNIEIYRRRMKQSKESHEKKIFESRRQSGRWTN